MDIFALKETLPNFPNEVLEEWLLPYAKSEGWPPVPDFDGIPSGRWRYLLGKRKLPYWQSLKWKLHERHVSIHDLHQKSKETMIQMVLGAVQGQHNIYSSSIPDLALRFNRIKDYISTNGILPKPPVLIFEENGLSVIDGNHRLAAYFYCYGYFNLDLDPSLQLKTNEKQSYWIGET